MRAIPYYSLLIVFGMGWLALLGWLFDIDAMKSVLPGLTAMNPMTAISFILSGVALLLLGANRSSRAARAVSLGIFGISLLKAVDLLLGSDIGIDHLLFAAKLEAGTVPNRMAPNTVISFLLFGGALYLTSRGQRPLAAQAMILLTALIGFVAVVGYVYNVKPFYGVLTYIPMALNTAVAFLLACISLFSLQPNTGLLAVWRSTTTGAVVARRLVPAAVLVPSLVGGLLLWGQNSGLYGAEFSAALVATVNALLLLGGVAWTANVMHHRDIERKRMEQALRESEMRYRSLFENSSDSILIANEAGCYIDANPQAENLTGYKHDEILNLCVRDLTLRPAGDDPHVSLVSSLRKHGYVVGEYMIAHKDGREIPVEYAAVSIGPGIYQSILHDIAARKQIEANLHSALEQERRLNELKSQFVSMVSHDFRTPLAAIQSSSDLLLNYSDRMEPAKRRDHLERIQQQVVHLTEMLNDLLTLSRAQAVGLDVHREAVDLPLFCAQVVSEVQLATSSHEIQFSQRGGGSEEMALIDRKLLKRALVNLITNAVKYSPGRTRVLVNLASDDQEITLIVKDEGIGIPEEDQPRLFELFHRAQNVGDIHGTGLGLPIVKQAVEAHGGTLDFESRLGEGTTFTIRLPYQRA